MARSPTVHPPVAVSRLMLASWLVVAGIAWPVAGHGDPFWKGGGSRSDLRQGYIPTQPADRPHLRGGDERSEKGAHGEAAEELRLSLEEAVDQVRESTGSRILSAKTVREDGDTVYRIKLLTPDHRVQVVRIDARTGERRR